MHTLCQKTCMQRLYCALKYFIIIINSVVLQDLTRIGSVVVSYILLSLASLGLLLVGSLVSTVLRKLCLCPFFSKFLKDV